MFGYQEKYAISIHAPRGGSDCLILRDHLSRMYFNPRSPRGERPNSGYMAAQQAKFQSTLPAGERLAIMGGNNGLEKFQSTLPAGERQSVRNELESAGEISIHAPRGGATFPMFPYQSVRHISIHAPRGGATPKGHKRKR